MAFFWMVKFNMLTPTKAGTGMITSVISDSCMELFAMHGTPSQGVPGVHKYFAGQRGYVFTVCKAGCLVAVNIVCSEFFFYWWMSACSGMKGRSEILLPVPGLEPGQGCPQQILSLSCLPISPNRHMHCVHGKYYTNEMV